MFQFHIPRFLRGWLVVALLAIGSSWNTAAQAAWCTTESGIANMNINLGTVSEGTSNPVAVGTVIYTKTGAWDAFNGHNAGWCKSSSGAYDRVQTAINFVMPGSPATGFTDVYPTNLRGVGVRISIWSSTPYYGTPIAPTAIPLTLIANLQNDQIGLSPAYGTGLLQIKVEVVKTATNWEAGTLQFTGGQMTATATSGSNIATFAAVNVAGTMNTRSCNIATDDIRVPLGTVSYPVNFSGTTPGAYGPTASFQVAMTCTSGPKTSIEFDAIPTAENANIIALEAGSASATGVGVQLLSSNGAPLNLKTDVPLVNPAPNGVNTFSFGARYYQTAAAVRGGTADAVATFTMSYE